MKHLPALVLGFAALVLCCLPGFAQAKEERARPAGSTDAAATLVLFNQNDADSRDLATFYASRRGIPKDQVVALDCPAREEITREEYDRTIADPLRRTFHTKGWWSLREHENPFERVESNKIRFVALMRGMPLKIAAVASYAGDKPSGPPVISLRNEAAVDSELAALAILARNISGAMTNPYFRSAARFADAKLPCLLLVARVDAASPATARRMITDAIAAEQNGLRGFAYVDARGVRDAGLAEGDNWLLKIAGDARRRGSPVVLDNGEGMFPLTYPMRHAALYFGWYSENVVGPMAHPEYRFRPGAVAVHIHSFSAATLREPRRYWAAPLLEAGAAATVGNVYEPFLAMTPNLDVFHERLRAGFNLAESAWNAQRALSWMTTVIGDPLYRPFKVEAESSGRSSPDEWSAYAAGARAWFEKPEQGRERLIADAKKYRSGMIMEGLGLLQLTANLPDDAMTSFRLARQHYKHPEDILRAAIHEIIQLRARSRQSEALALTRKQLALYGRSPAAELLRAFEREMTPVTTGAVEPRNR